MTITADPVLDELAALVNEAVNESKPCEYFESEPVEFKCDAEATHWVMVECGKDCAYNNYKQLSCLEHKDAFVWMFDTAKTLMVPTTCTICNSEAKNLRWGTL